MSTKRRRPLLVAATALVGLWLVAGTGYFLANRSKATADRVMAYMNGIDPAAMSSEQRQRALLELSRQLNELPPEERRQVRMGGDWDRWFSQLTEGEKSDFIEATMPSGFKQMLASFEQLPEEKRRKTVEDALRELRRARDSVKERADPAAEQANPATPPPVLSEELQQKVVQIGLKAFYSESSAQTKAELAPVLEEMQRSMEGGSLFRRPRR